MISDELHKSVSRLVLGHCRAQYEELSNTWRDIEHKAQGIVALAAALLAGVFILFRSIEEPTKVVLLFFVASMLILLVSILFALVALVVAEVECIDDSSEIRSAGKRILEAKNNKQAKKELRQFVFDHAKDWERICNNLHAANTQKSSNVLKSQKWLFAGVVGVGISLTVLILDPSVA